MEKPALVVERLVVAGPCARDEIDALPDALLRVRWIGVRGRDLEGNAAHETGLEPTARQHVDHRHLLGDAHGIATVGDRIAQDQQPPLARLPGEDRQIERRAGIEAGRGLMVLVDHQVKTCVVGFQVAGLMSRGRA